jgi:hypothetical protein
LQDCKCAILVPIYLTVTKRNIFKCSIDKTLKILITSAATLSNVAFHALPSVIYVFRTYLLYCADLLEDFDFFCLFTGSGTEIAAGFV